ncbi:MAG TPA: amidohydrolase family protein, partial [Bryobacteraceae bacterium]
KLLLKDYRPVSIYKIPKTKVTRAKFSIIDMHSHDYAKSDADVARWVAVMDKVGIETTVILSGATGAEFNAIVRKYSKYPGRFEMWCGFDYTGYDKPGYGPAAVKELERCYRLGARGVGELSDKGQGMAFGKTFAKGMHPDDARMDPLFEKCAQLGIPVNLHVADPIWMYQKMDATNDGLMNAWTWRLDNQPGIVGHSGMVDILEKTAKRHPRLTLIACHFANLDYDLGRLGELFDRNPNLYADVSARYAETAATPRFASRFINKYNGRLVYGTDMGMDPEMYHTTFRILETEDEHFYDRALFSYHWNLSGFGLPDTVLKRLYRENALKLRAKR